MSGAALYIHIPFCRAKCIYCDFYSVTALKLVPQFESALLSEINQLASRNLFHNQTFTTIYFGGGTPSLMTPDFFKTTLQHLSDRFTIAPDAEISFEANPGALLDSSLQSFPNMGLKRITIGVQSFNDAELKTLSRIHTSAQALNALDNARLAGFNNIGLDLIFGIPGQDLQSLQKTLQQAIDFSPQHISFYGLTIEHGTPLDKAVHNQTLAPCDEEVERDMFLTGADMLTKAGYEHYEISNYSLPGFESKHNQKYWNGSPYLGLGPSAHSFDGQNRWWNIASVKEYLTNLSNSTPVIEKQEPISLDQQLEETIMLGLRRREGISLLQWEKLTGENLVQQAGNIIQGLGGFDYNTRPLHVSESNKFLTMHNNTLALTRQGLLLYDTICERFFDLI